MSTLTISSKADFARQIFKTRLRGLAGRPTPSITFDDPIIERAEVLIASIAIIDRDQTIVDTPYQCQIDAIRFLTKYQFVDTLRYIVTSIHATIGRRQPAFHPLTVFRLAVHLNNIELCGRIIAEMGHMRISSIHRGSETFGEPIHGAGVFSAGSMSLLDVESLPLSVYWALGRAEVVCGSANYRGIAMEFMRLMRLQGEILTIFQHVCELADDLRFTGVHIGID